MRLLTFFLVVFTSCSSNKKYTVRIHSMDSVSKKTAEEIESFESKNDTAAYKEGCSKYWIKKYVILEMNKRFEQSDAVPFYFEVVNDKGEMLKYSKEESERLNKWTVDYYTREKIPALDTIVPLSKQKKEPAANIY